MVRLNLSALILTTALPFLTEGASVRWMPLGDSITDYGCWRAWIWERFQKEGYDIDLVGGERAGENCNSLSFDRDHEGHPGFQAYDIATKNQLIGWLKKNPADIVTMHLGTNDIIRVARKASDILAAQGKLIDQMRESNPEMRIIVAQIIPLANSNNNRQVRELNSAIPAWAASKNSTASPIWVVDQNANFSATADLYDGIHASASGDVKIADRFYPAIIEAYHSITRT